MPSRVLRHCMVVDNHYPDIRVEREANALIERGHRVDIICLRTPGTSRVERIGRLTIYRLPVSRRRGASAVTQLWEYTAFLAWATAMVTLRHLKARYDVVQVHNVPDFLVFSAGFAKATGAAVLLDLHDLMPEFFASRFGGDLRGPLARLVLLQERAAIHVVMNVPDERRFPIREPLTRSDGPVTVVYHGTLTRRYGLDILLTAFADARARHPMRLLIHGRGEFADDARRLANDLGLGDAVTFSNALLTTDELAALIGQGDIGVVPNRNDILTDGILPTKLMEYAALGIPGIVSRSTAVASYFTDDMVRFVEPGNSDDLADALVELAAHPEERAALARNAQRFSREHRWSDQAAAYVDLVERLADARSTKSGNGRETTT
jgi:glycosyltransferase involved in cell wall biosynthesis